jgi:hypothetical protein
VEAARLGPLPWKIERLSRLDSLEDSPLSLIEIGNEGATQGTGVFIEEEASLDNSHCSML